MVWRGQPNAAAAPLASLPLVPPQARQAEEQGKACLPAGHGMRVSAAELAKGGAAASGDAADLLRERPFLQHLGFSLRANHITHDMVGHPGG